MILEDGKTGSTAAVDDNNRLQTSAVIKAQDKQANLDGFHYSVYFQVTPTGANDYFFYFQNTSPFNLNISEFKTLSTVATTININKVSGTPSAGTSAQITNRNLSRSNLPTSIARYDSDITGLTSLGTLLYQNIPSANQSSNLLVASNIIIPQGGAIAMQRVAATGQITCLISLYREL